MSQSIEQQIMNTAMIALRSRDSVTIDVVRKAVAEAAEYLSRVHDVRYDKIDIDNIVRDIEASRAIWAPDSTELQDSAGHIPWLEDKAPNIAWDYWRRYEFYAENNLRLPSQVVQRLDTITNRVLGYLEDPGRTGKWSRRGMVVGQVQSGKTGNYMGLICKAVDAGYKLIVVLTGMHNSLRSQTQLRIDEGFIGRDTKQSRAYTQDSGVLGVGNVILTDRRLAVYSPTSSADDGDFRAAIARQFTTYIGSDPVILVVKKNGTVLKHLLRWIKTNLRDARGNLGLPILMLDDEADNASVNTSEDSPTKINSLIRQILNQFDKSAYVGYTATPFANIFIPPDGNSHELGDDLFPGSFIINLHPPTNYIGPTRVFGLNPLPDSGMDGQSGLPIVRLVDDSDLLIPPSHKKDLRVVQLPQSLTEAVRAFVISCAARHARGQGTKHNSMLVHVTRFNAVQEAVSDLVDAELRDIKQRVAYGDGARSPSMLDELHNMWESDFVPTTEQVAEAVADDQIVPLSWQQVEDSLKISTAKIQVRTINGLAGDVLDYFDHPNGISVIAIGGDKLSRGLTLEGLTVSYFLRATRMYDTLMQMGRWFGYRPGYVDLCRLYTSQDLREWYEHVTLASEELRLEFDRMAGAGMTPMDYGLRVQNHPGALTITSAGKMRSGRVVKVSFAAGLIESYLLSKSPEAISLNYQAADVFLRSLGAPSDRKRQGHVWTDVSGSSVAEYFGSLRGVPGHYECPASQPQRIGDYIYKKMDRDELTAWTVVLIDRLGSETPVYRIGGLEGVHLTQRQPDLRRTGPTDDLYRVTNRHVISESDEWIDLTPDELKSALSYRISQWTPKTASDREPTEPSGPFVRAERPPCRGLLLLYLLDPQYKDIFDAANLGRDGLPFVAFAASFPETLTPSDSVEYVVNSVYLQEEEEYEREAAE